jgi:hypothetical protein
MYEIGVVIFRAVAGVRFTFPDTATIPVKEFVILLMLVSWMAFRVMALLMLTSWMVFSELILVMLVNALLMLVS